MNKCADFFYKLKDLRDKTRDDWLRCSKAREEYANSGNAEFSLSDYYMGKSDAYRQMYEKLEELLNVLK